MLPHLLVTNRRIERLLHQRIYISHQVYNTEFVKSLGSRFSPLFFHFNGRIEARINKTNGLAVAGTSNSGEIAPRLRKLG
jgi:hypothetical protein